MPDPYALFARYAFGMACELIILRDGALRVATISSLSNLNLQSNFWPRFYVDKALGECHPIAY